MFLSSVFEWYGSISDIIKIIYEKYYHVKYFVICFDMNFYFLLYKILVNYHTRAGLLIFIIMIRINIKYNVYNIVYV